MKQPLKQVWKCGGGAQSCAIAVLILQGRLPKPDIALISDTHYETEATWDYYNAVLRPAMQLAGVNLVRVAANVYNAKRAALFYEYADPERESDLEIPAFSTRFGTVGKLKNFCTGRWKVETGEKYIRQVHGLTRSQYVGWIGFSRDEQTRIMRMQRGQEYIKGLIRFPLLTDVPTTRIEAINLVKDFGWPEPPRSACYICPNHSDTEWRKMKDERPEEFEKACVVEDEIHKRDPDAFLNKRCVSLRTIDFSKPKDLLSSLPCDSGECFV